MSRFCGRRSGRKAQGDQIVRCLQFHTPVIDSRRPGGAQSHGREMKATRVCFQRPGCDRWCIPRQEGHLRNEVMTVTTRAGIDVRRNGSLRGKPEGGFT